VKRLKSEFFDFTLIPALIQEAPRLAFQLHTDIQGVADVGNNLGPVQLLGQGGGAFIPVLIQKFVFMRIMPQHYFARLPIRSYFHIAIRVKVEMPGTVFVFVNMTLYIIEIGGINGYGKG
jgi:hypothetical protein